MKQFLLALLTLGFVFGVAACDELDPKPDYPTECPDGGEGSCRDGDS